MVAAGPIVELDRVSYIHYGKDSPALVDVSLTIERGSFTIVVGPSGSGKSSLCLLLNGIVPHVLGGRLTGRALVSGRDVASTPVRELAQVTGLLFQDPELMFATLRVEDEVAFGPENLRLPVPEVRARVAGALEQVGLTGERLRLVWALSGGQVQRLGLATVLAMRAPLVVLDEPTANLDPATTEAVHRLILRLREAGTSVLLVTKELDESMTEADKLVVLDRGRVVAQGIPEKVVAEHGWTLLHELGVWLPEAAQIGLHLKRSGRLPSGPIPLTVGQATERLAGVGFREVALPSDPRPPGEVLVRARDVEYAYDGKVQALRGVSLDIHEGEMLAIVGQNGAGKSTLAKLLVGLLKPQGGRLELFGRPARDWTVHGLASRVGLVFQNPEHQFLCDTVYDEVAYSLLAQGLDDPLTVERSVHDMLHQLDLVDALTDHPFALSAGAKRRLGVATMLVGGQVKVLVVDEPTYGQDRRLTERLMELLRSLREGGITVVMITHDMRLVEAHAERLLVMAGGEVVFDGSPGDLFQRPELVSRAALRPTGLRRLVECLRRQGVAVPDGVVTVEAFVEAVVLPGMRARAGASAP